MAPRHPKMVGGMVSEGPRADGQTSGDLDGQTSGDLDAPPEQQRGEVRAESEPAWAPTGEGEDRREPARAPTGEGRERDEPTRPPLGEAHRGACGLEEWLPDIPNSEWEGGALNLGAGWIMAGTGWNRLEQAET